MFYNKICIRAFPGETGVFVEILFIIRKKQKNRKVLKTTKKNDMLFTNVVYAA